MELDLVKITRTGPKWEENCPKVEYQVYCEEEMDGVTHTQGEYSYIGRDFDIEDLGKIEIYQTTLSYLLQFIDDNYFAEYLERLVFQHECEDMPLTQAVISKMGPSTVNFLAKFRT